jgi:hypothetical protein
MKRGVEICRYNPIQIWRGFEVERFRKGDVLFGSSEVF